MAEVTEWAVALRPKTLDQMIGQEANVEILKGWVEHNNLPNSIIFYGKSGTGKTTGARAIANMLDAELIELDAASHNGVDDARQLNEQAARLSLTGRHKIFLVDECFPAGTLISCPEGQRNIEDIRPGDTVKCITGEGTVEAIFSKSISRTELAQVLYNTDCRAQVTKDHLFLTQRGWVPAQYLIKGDVLYGEALSDLWKTSAQKKPEDLLEAVRDYLSALTSNKARNSSLCNMREGVSSETERPSSNLLEGMSLLIDRFDEFRTKMLREKQAEDAGAQPSSRPTRSRKNKGNEEAEWDGQITAKLSGRQWAYYRAAEAVVRSLGVGVEIRSSDSDWCEECARGWLSDLLQGGYWSLGKEAGSRGGWGRTLLEMLSVAGCQEDPIVGKFRVDGVKVYERGNSSRCAEGSSADTDEVTVYDLQVREHPSYVANGVFVHNCHMLSNGAWNALLKNIEEPNPRVHFLWATTDYTKLPMTIRGRSRMLKFYSVAPEQMKEYAQAVLDYKGYTLKDEVIDLIVQQSKGQVRDMLKLLQTTCEGNLNDVIKLQKFLAIPDSNGMRTFINAVLAHQPKQGVAIIKKINTDLIEWVIALQNHIYQLLEDKYNITPFPFGDNITLQKQVKTIEGLFTDQQFGLLLTELNKIRNVDTAYAQLFALLFRGVE